MRTDDLYYYEGEKPPPLAINYVDRNGTLVTTIPSVTARALTSIDEAVEVAVAMTNNGDGSLTINWPTGTSVFVLTGEIDGVMRVDIEITQGSTVWFLPRFAVPVRKRT